MTGYQKASVEDVLNQLMEENRKLTERVETLEENFVEISNAYVDLQSEVNDLKKQITNKGNAHNMRKQGSFYRSNEVKIPKGYKCKGWIFYPNEDDGNCLYKIKEDGTCNTKLTDYSVELPEIWSYDSGYVIVQLSNMRNYSFEEKIPV